MRILSHPSRLILLPFLAVVPLAALPAAVMAQAPPASPVRLTLDDAVRRAFQSSHRVGEMRAREEAARATLKGRQLADLPQLSVQAGYTRTSHVEPFGLQPPGQPLQVIYPDIPDNYRSRIDVQWPMYTFGRTAAAERGAAAEAEASAKDVDTARADLKLDVTRAFWATVTARESVRVLEESLKRMDASLQDVQNRVKAGLVPPNDVLSVQAQRSRQQMLLIQARNQADVVAADLSRLAGLPPGTAVEPDAVLDRPAPSVDQPALETLVAQGKQARPDRMALAQRVTAAGERLHAADASRRPLLAAGGGVDLARPNPRIFPRMAEFRAFWDASISFSYVFWDGGRADADMAEATAAQRAIRERLAEMDSVIELDVRQRWLEVQSSGAAVTAAVDSVAAASEARRVVGDRFAAGVATSTDVLDAQVALLQAHLDRTQSLANLRLAEARLDRAVGR
jgi:outer membrane protein